VRSEPPTERPRQPPPRRATSLVMVNTGHGKGKSTAAFGTMLRAVARGWNVCVIQFIKSGEWRVGEEEIGRRLGVQWWTTGDGFTWNSRDMDETEARAREAWRIARQTIESGDFEMILLDEITYAINFGWIDVRDVVAVLGDRPDRVNVIATGRDAPTELVDVADTVTEMTKVKHAYDQGIRAKRGIDL
jgi:cob(I)alamin adenosyltransferase